jgi:hypothetical protein
MEHVTLLQVIGWSLFSGLVCIGKLTLIYFLHNYIKDSVKQKNKL